MLGLIAIILLVVFQTVAAQEPEPESNLVSVFRAVSRSEGKKTLLLFENRASRHEQLANAGEMPSQNWELAARAYREASHLAHFLGDLQKAISYGERAYALAEKLQNRHIKLASLSSLASAHRRTRNFAKVDHYVEVGFKVANELPAQSLDWMWWQGVFHLQRGRDYRRLKEYEKAVQDLDQTIHLKQESLKTIPGTGQEVENRKEQGRTNILLAITARGDAYLAWGKYDQALESYRKGLELAKE